MKKLTLFFLSLMFAISGCVTNNVVKLTYHPTGNLGFDNSLSKMPVKLQLSDQRKEKIFIRHFFNTAIPESGGNYGVHHWEMEKPSLEFVEQALKMAMESYGYSFNENPAVELHIILREFIYAEIPQKPWNFTGYMACDVLVKKSAQILTKKRISEKVDQKLVFPRVDQDPQFVLNLCLNNFVERIASDSSILVGIKKGYGVDIVQEGVKDGTTEKPGEVAVPKAKRAIVSRIGTGFVVSNDGHIITAYHIVKDTTEIMVKFENGNWLLAKLENYSFSNDVAVLKVNQSTRDYLSFVNSKDVKQGQKVFTLGYPVFDVLGNEPKYAEGTISSLSGIMGEYSLMQISVPVQPGNSGGPLVDVSGGVIGMVTSTIAVEAFFKETGTLPQNINWAVKADYIIPLVPHQRLSETEIETKNTISDPVALVKKSVCLVKTK